MATVLPDVTYNMEYYDNYLGLATKTVVHRDQEVMQMLRSSDLVQCYIHNPTNYCLVLNVNRCQAIAAGTR